jgi:predicted ATPase/DNA-binding CsgD family transcriptional regulator
MWPSDPEPTDEDASISRLPAALTSLVGREREIGVVRDLLLRPDVRLLTLTGPGGIGKTRLALAAADAVAASFADGVVFVALAPIVDAALVLPTIAQTMAVPERGNAPLIARLERLCAAKRRLLVLDNFEHLLEAAPPLAEILVRCPFVKMLVTSRTLLRISGERRFSVTPLTLPGPLPRWGAVSRPPSIADVAASEAVRLYVARAQTVDSSFALTEENAPVVAAICRRLDGLPLAIELAAARANELSPADLLARLERRLTYLTEGPRDQPPRLRDMSDAIRWSFELLPGDERAFFARLAVFANGFSLEAAACAADELPADAAASKRPASAGAAPPVLALITSLLDACLLRREESSGANVRFGMFETIREFGLERLAESGAEAQALDAHAAYYMNLVERWAPDHFRDADVVRRLGVIEADYDNIRAALTRLIATDGEAAVRLAGQLAPFWYLRARIQEGRSWLERALDRAPTAPPRLRAAALTGLGMMRMFLHDLHASSDAFERALVAARAANDLLAVAFVRMGQAILALQQGDFAAASAYGDESATLYERLGDRRHAIQGRFVEARAMLYEGEMERAEARYRQLLNDASDLPYPRAMIEYSLAMLLGARGDHRQALDLSAAALGHLLEFGEMWGFAACLDTIAAARAALGRPARAARLFGAAAAIRAACATPMIPADQPRYSRAVDAARAMVGSAAFDAAWQSGAVLSPGEAAAEALADTDESRTAASANDGAGAIRSPLTERERAVLRLLVRGYSDKEIGAELGLTRRSASKHVSAILAKLDAPSRTAAATIALRNCLI